MTKAIIPGWAKRVSDLIEADVVTEQAVHGLFGNHPALVGRLGELLVRRRVSEETLRAFIAEHDERNRDLQAFWAEVWSGILGRTVEVPPPPVLKDGLRERLEALNLMVAFQPAISEDDYPDFFVKPDRGRYIDAPKVERRALIGRWVAVDTTPSSDWDDQDGYGGGNDPVARALELNSRFGISRDNLKGTHLPALARHIGLKNKKALRLTTLEEWNLWANVMNHLRDKRGMGMPDLGSTASWEWTENAYGSGCCVVAGSRDDGGLAGVDYGVWPGDSFAVVGFRVLVVL